jgi:predicted DNA-binding protein (UPF0278 family)
VVTIEHWWKILRDVIEEYIASLSWGYRVQLREGKIDYLNALDELVDFHTIKKSYDRQEDPTS